MIFSNLFSGLKKTRDKISSSLGNVFSKFSKIDDDFYDELEEILITADVGVLTSEDLIDSLRKKVKEEKVTDPNCCKELLILSMTEIIRDDNIDENQDKYPRVLLLVGVNGVGKTTTCGKLASIYKEKGKSVTLVAADTFRAGAIEQLSIWAKRANVDLIKGVDGADPASVIFDAIKSAISKKTDVLIVDTAGRIHNKKNLMAQLSKIRKVIDKEFLGAICETYVILDGTTGQNAIIQAKEFNEAANLNAIILTKLDGTAKGGIAFAIHNELQLPIKYIGVGEKIEDLQDFDAKSFVKALVGE